MTTTASSAFAAPDPSPKRHMPGEAGIWLFVLGDMVMFSLFFIVFMYYRGHDVPLFADSQTHLNQGLGVLNTFFMLTSSWCVATAVRAARHNMGRVTPLLLLAAIGCGVAFGVVKVVEYGEKIHAGIGMTTNDFYMYYFMFTGIHFVHVILGTSLLVILTLRTWSGATLDAGWMRNLESAATFWHLIDLLWIVLFALLYLVK